MARPKPGWMAALLMLAATPALAQAPAAPSLEQALGYPFVSDLVAAAHADRIAWVQDVRGVRNVWMAEGPGFAPRKLTRYTADDGQELTGLAWSPDGRRLVYVRGGDHDANWDAAGKLAPNPTGGPEQPKITIWTAPLDGGAPVQVAEGDAPAISARGVLAYVKDDQVWTAPLAGAGKAQRLLFDRGHDGGLVWSPDGSKLAFVSDRGDHAFVSVYTDAAHPLVYLAPSTGVDAMPVWSPDGTRLAFTRQPGKGGVPEPLLTRTPHPWAIWTADAASGAGQQVWKSPDTLDGSYPDPGLGGGANLLWGANGQLAFVASLDGWNHLYSLQASGGAPVLLTPGPFMVENGSLSRDGLGVVYDANTGGAAGDGDRRHLFRVPLAGGAPVSLSAGAGLEWSPVMAGAAHVAFVAAGPQRPAAVGLTGTQAAGLRQPRTDGAREAYAAQDLVIPRPVSFKAPDGTLVHGQLFAREDGAAKTPGVIFVHGGPPRQMLLGWSYMDYYANAYAVNQYLATHGFVVLSVNYRLGIGYGRAFQQPEHGGPAGSSEYQDVLAGARFLQQVHGVDPERIGIWGGSYGGLLTALALARNSDVFKAGVDFHGVHDWSRDLAEEAQPPKRYEQGDWAEFMRVAFASSPDADIARWRSPVLLIQGDDDRNVRFDQTVDLARRLDAQGVRYEELVIPNEIHGFLRYASWLKADRATVDFLTRELGAKSSRPSAGRRD